MRGVKRIIIHHSLTDDSRTLSWGAIRDNHKDTGWFDIGYHAGAEVVRDGIECLYGRPDTVAGAHCAGHNHDSLGFCFVGDFDKQHPSDELLEIACRRVIVPWLVYYGLNPEDIRPHSDFSEKTCPGKMFDMARLRQIAAEILEEMQ